jgi:hypothetical protein
MEYKVKIYEVIIKDKNSDEQQFIRTVRSPKQISDFLYETERDALDDIVYDLSGFIAQL